MTAIHDPVHRVRPALAPAIASPPLDRLAARIAERSARVAVVGMGYVGLPLLLAVDGAGFPSVGIDVDADRVHSLRAGRSYVTDVTDAELAAAGSRYSADPAPLREADVVVLAVPTPLRDGVPDLSLVKAAAGTVAETLRPGQLVVLESTTYPGTTEELVVPLLSASGLRAGHDFAVAYSPERINPGSGWTLRDTPKVVAGLGRRDLQLAQAFYGAFVDRVVPTATLKAAEMAKLIENTFRQVNIALVNELATIATAIGVDLWDALDAAATKPFGYMPFWPGPGVGGHCIAIDPSYLSWTVEQRLGFGIGFIEHARSVNNRMPAYVTSRIGEVLNEVGKALHGARVLVVGLAYKAGVNDVRESPALAVVERLLAAGADCSYHDPYVAEVSVGGRRAGDVLRTAPGEPRRRLQSVALTPEAVAAADCVVILAAHPTVDHDALADGASLVFDAVGVTRNRRCPNTFLL